MSIDGIDGFDMAGGFDEVGSDLMGQLGQLQPEMLSGFGADVVTPAMNPMLTNNLAALALKSPHAARAIEAAMSSPAVSFYATDEGIDGADLHGIAMASRRRPMSEAKRFAQKLDPSNVACCAIMGFGLGYHCGTLLEQLGRVGVVMCFEPDVGMLRAVLEKIDYSAMFKTGRFFLFTQADDSVVISQAFTGIEAVIGMGVEIMNHPPSSQRLAESSKVFGVGFTTVLKATRTHVMTTLANSRVSFRNALMNLDVYSASAGIESLKDTQKGKPAIVVSAGPSLAKNIELLRDPAVRDSMVIIAVQTVLRQLLENGIKPHFVAALDYHEISKRFYEGITAEDVKGVRLIAEAKANPAIFDAFPGEVLCVSDTILDDLIGDELRKDMGSLESGGTVAHLCYYFARFLGCDPVIFIGQDLGFSDGQYYSAGAAIHQVWSGELNPHNTLEMMEWQRIIRMKGLISKRTDIHGRSIYLDEQMSAYLAQFESDFERDQQRGLRVIDATEGGVMKAHTQIMPLDKAIELYGSGGKLSLAQTDHLGDQSETHRLAVEQRVDQIIRDGKLIAEYSDETIRLLKKINKHQQDQKRVNKLIGQVQSIRDKVVKFEVAFRFTEAVNQVGVLNRMKQDREINLGGEINTMERQRLQVKRDITNVTWTRDAALAMVEQLESAKSAFRGESVKETTDRPEDQKADGSSVSRTTCVHAAVLVDPDFGGLGTRRDLREKIANGMNALEITIARLDQSSELDAITIITPEPDVIGRMVESIQTRLPMQVVGVDRQKFRSHAKRAGAARMQSSECWRGSIGMLSVYDEQFHPSLVWQVMNDHHIDAVAIVGGDWAMIDSGLVDKTVARFRIQDSDKRIAFSQAVPGLGTMVVDRETIGMFAQTDADGARRNPLTTIGALVGYIPTVPQFDPIAKGICVDVPIVMRDVGVRLIADSSNRIAMMRDAYETMNSSPIAALSETGIEYVGQLSEKHERACPQRIVIETCTGRLIGGDWGQWKRGSPEPIERKAISFEHTHELLKEIASMRDDATVVFDGVGDPLMHPQAIELVELAKECGIACVELRTDLSRERFDVSKLMDSGLDILSVDILAETRERYVGVCNADRLEAVYGQVQTIFDSMRSDSACSMWFVPRLTRCDAVYEDIEAFFDKWLMLCGSAVIDPLPCDVDDQLVKALPNPARRNEQLTRSTLRVRCDGVVVDQNHHELSEINVFEAGVEQTYRQVCSVNKSTLVESKPSVLVADESAA